MTDHKNRKKKLIVSYKNLTDDIRELFKDAYPDGYQEYMQKTLKPNGEPLFVVPLETDDTSYMIKFDVKIDTGLVEEDLDKDLYGDDDQPESEFVPLSEAIDKEEGNNRAVGKMRHGALEEILDGLPDAKKEFEIASADNEDLNGDDDDDLEPDDDELLDIESLLEEADAGEGILREDNPPEERRGRKRKNESAEIKAVRAVKEEVKEAKKTRKAKDDKPSRPAKATVAAKPAKATAPAKAAKAPKTAVAAKPAKAAKPATEKKSTKKK